MRMDSHRCTHENSIFLTIFISGKNIKSATGRIYVKCVTVIFQGYS